MMADLADALEASIEAVETGGRFVAAWDLPSEETLHAINAQLWLGVRTQRLFRCEPVLVMPTKVG
jgi:hypothetical protein